MSRYIDLTVDISFWMLASFIHYIKFYLTMQTNALFWVLQFVTQFTHVYRYPEA